MSLNARVRVMLQGDALHRRRRHAESTIGSSRSRRLSKPGALSRTRSVGCDKRSVPCLRNTYGRDCRCKGSWSCHLR